MSSGFEKPAVNFVINEIFLRQTYAEYKISTGADLHKYRDACKTELSIPDETIEQFKKWTFDDDKSACYIHCVFKHMDLYDDESGFHVSFLAHSFLRHKSEKTYAQQVDNLVTQLGQGRTDDVRTSVEGCVDNTITDHCERAFAGFKCFSKNNLRMIKSSVN